MTDLLRIRVVDNNSRTSSTEQTLRLAALFDHDLVDICQGLGDQPEGYSDIHALIWICSADNPKPSAPSQVRETIGHRLIVVVTGNPLSDFETDVVFWHEDETQLRYSLFLRLINAWWLATGVILDNETTLWIAHCIGLAQSDLGGWNLAHYRSEKKR